MTVSINCSSCGAAVPFTSRTSVSATCAYCQSVLVRTDIDVKSLGKFAQLLDDLTPLQIGSQGRYDGRSFTLLGRARWKWNGGFWNEWHMSFGGGEHGWLGEAQGQFYPCLAAKNAQMPDVEALTPGTVVKLAGKSFTASDVKTATCVGCEGELPSVIKPGTVKRAVDLGDEAGAYACIETEAGETHIYLGTVTDSDTLALSNLRMLDGW